ncbi:MAG: hypothetical protein ABUT20_44340 [Bacteroidota bacterium]
MPHLTLKHWLIAALPVIIAVTAIAWQTKEKKNTAGLQQSYSDTIPSKKEAHKNLRVFDEDEDAKDIDDDIRKLDDALKNADGKLNNIDWDKIHDEVQKALEKANEAIDHQHIDMEKIQKDVDEAMKNIDFEKIERETKKAMQHAAENIDFKKMQDDINKSLAEEKEYFNSDAFKESLEAVKKVNMDEVRENVDAAMKELKDNKVDMEEAMSNAREEIKNAKEELVGFREMLNDMEKNGLIDTKGDYNIEYDNGELYINHQKQAQNITDKYKGYFKKDGTRIYKRNGRFNINID